MKKIFVIISILFLFTFSIYSEVNKLPSFIETSIGKFVLKYELFYTCILENDGEEIVLSFSFKRDCTKAEIEKNINDLVALKSSFNSRKRFQSTFQDVG